MENKICVVTGATAGIGRQTALFLAKKGYAVQIVGRNKEKCEAVLHEVEAINPGGRHQYFVGDFSDLGDVRMLANMIQKNLSHIDVLVNNAGGVYAKKELTADGIEKTLSTNHLAPFLLTLRLLPLLEKSKNARIVNVASDSHYSGKFDFNDMNYDHKRYFVLGAYERSKLGNVLFTRQLSKLIENKGITVNALHPGVVNTNIGQKNTNAFFGFVWSSLSGLFGISDEQGAATSVYLASSPEVANVTGKYFDKCKEKRASRLALDDQLAQKLWDWSLQATGEKFTG